MLATFDTPWYAWPTTASVAAGFFAIGIAAWAFFYSRHLKVLDAVTKIGYSLQKVDDGIAYAAMPSPDYGVRLERLGGWDALADLLNELGIATRLLSIYGDSEIEACGKALFEEVKKVFLAVHEALIYAKTSGPKNSLWEQKLRADKLIVSLHAGEAQKGYWQKFDHLRLLARSNVKRPFKNLLKWAMDQANGKVD